MLLYQSVITNAATKFPMSRWYYYDKRFRLKFSNDQSMAWDQIHTGLWLECFTSSSSMPGPRTNPPPGLDSQNPPIAKSDIRPCTYCGSILHFPHSCQKAPLFFRNSQQIPPRASRPPRDQGGPRGVSHPWQPPTKNLDGAGNSTAPVNVSWVPNASTFTSADSAAANTQANGAGTACPLNSHTITTPLRPLEFERE